jgi:hypothetical protein
MVAGYMPQLDRPVVKHPLPPYEMDEKEQQVYANALAVIDM